MFGGGYPYVLKRAVAAAALSDEDGERFLTILQKFAKANDFLFRYDSDSINRYW